VLVVPQQLPELLRPQEPLRPLVVLVLELLVLAPLPLD
jgi:hypothetical protein